MVKILVVDDERDVCDFTQTFFRDRGFEVFSAGGGEEALLLVKEKNPDIVLLDIKMQYMDGIKTLNHIKEIAPSTIVVMVTALNDTDRMKEATLLGARDYVTKPLVLEELEKKVLTIAQEIKK